MFLVNERNEQIEIWNAVMLATSEKETVILCTSAWVPDNFITPRLTATFGHDTYAEYKGLASFESTYTALYDDQFIIRLIREATHG